MIALVAGRTTLAGRNDRLTVRYRGGAFLGCAFLSSANAEADVARIGRIVRQLETLRIEMWSDDAAATALRAHLGAQIVLVRMMHCVGFGRRSGLAVGSGG